MSTIFSAVTSSWTLWSSPSTLYSFAEYLVLDDGGFLNALLLEDFIPSTSDHLFWDWNLESFFSVLRLAVISGRFYHHWQFWEYINVPWSMDYFKCLTSTHLFTLVRLHSIPWFPFPFSLSVGDLASVNDIHQWPVIKWWTTMFDLETSIHIGVHALVSDCVEDLWDWWHFIYATSLIMPVFMRF